MKEFAQREVETKRGRKRRRIDEGGRNRRKENNFEIERFASSIPVCPGQSFPPPRLTYPTYVVQTRVPKWLVLCKYDARGSNKPFDLSLYANTRPAKAIFVFSCYFYIKNIPSYE